MRGGVVWWLYFLWLYVFVWFLWPSKNTCSLVVWFYGHVFEGFHDALGRSRWESLLGDEDNQPAYVKPSL